MKTGRFTEDENRFLVEKYGSMTADEIAKQLDRNQKAVRNRIDKLGLRKNGESKPSRDVKAMVAYRIVNQNEKIIKMNERLLECLKSS